MQKILILILIAFVLPLSKAYSQTEDVVWLKENFYLEEFKFHPTQDIFTSFNQYWKGLKIFDKMTGDSIGMFTMEEPMYKLKYFFSNDGKYLLTSSIQGYVRVWDFDTKEIVFTSDISTYLPEDVAKEINVRQLDLSNDQKYLAISLGGAGFIVFDFEKQKVIKNEYWSYTDPKWGKSYLFVNSIDISPDNNLVIMNRIAGGYNPNGVVLYNIKQNKTELFDMGSHAIFSPTDNVMYYFRDAYDDQTGEVKSLGRYYVNFDISDEPIKSPASLSDCVFSFDGKFIVVRSDIYFENVFYQPYIYKTDDLYHFAYKRPYNDVFTIGRCILDYSNNFILGGSNQGLALLDLKGVLTSAKEDANDSIKVFPNPANKTITIKTDIEHTGLLKIEIQNIDASINQTLKKEIVEVGEYSEEFDISAMPQGTYFITLEFSGQTESRKIVVVR
jgi:WD40 repeat protein